MGKSDSLKKYLNHCPLCKEDISWIISGFMNKDVMRCPACHAAWKYRWITKDILCMGLKEVGTSHFVKKYDLTALLIDDKNWAESNFQLSTFWTTYKEQKEADEKRILELKKEEIATYLASYLGGDTSCPKPFVFRQVGTLRVTKDKIAFIGSISKGAPSYLKAVQNPLLEILLTKIDLTNFKLTTPLTNPSGSLTPFSVVLIIPYVDDTGIQQHPLFHLELGLAKDQSQKRLNQFYKSLYKTILKTRKQNIIKK